MDQQIIRELVSTSNLMFFISELMIVAFNIKLLLTNDLVGQSRQVMIAWVQVGVGYAFRIGFWLVALYHTPEQLIQVCKIIDGELVNCVTKHQTYPGWAGQWKWVHIFAASLVVWGNINYYCAVNACRPYLKPTLFVGITALAFFLGHSIYS